MQLTGDHSSCGQLVDILVTVCCLRNTPQTQAYQAAQGLVGRIALEIGLPIDDRLRRVAEGKPILTVSTLYLGDTCSTFQRLGGLYGRLQSICAYT